MDVNLIILLLLVVGLAGLVIRSQRSRFPGSKSPEAELFRLCNADKELQERLLRYEHDREPGISRRVAAERAAHRLRRDK